MASELLCIMHKKANDLACGRLWMGTGEEGKGGMSGCLINVVRIVHVIRII